HARHGTRAGRQPGHRRVTRRQHQRRQHRRSRDDGDTVVAHATGTKWGMIVSRLLVVEDDPDIAMALRLLLTRAGHQVAHAKDGRTGLRDAYTERPELVILDIGLPGMDGWQVLERLRDVSDVPVLLLTAHGQES